MDVEELRRNWNSLGEEDPLWAVLSDPSKRGQRWDFDEFYATGEEHIRVLLDRIQSQGLDVQFGSALDFGCGVGRLTFPLSRRFSTCVGVDIAASMLEFAEKARSRLQRPNCTFLPNPGTDLSAFADGSFDLVLSFIVLQHMPPALAKGYIAEFCRILRPGGVLAIQVPSLVEEIFADAALPPEAFEAEIHILESPETDVPLQVFPVMVQVRNTSPAIWMTSSDHPINVGNHWIQGDDVIRVDDGRTALPQRVLAGQEVVVPVHCNAPSSPGTYSLEVDLVQEGVAWFAHRGSKSERIEIEVIARAPSQPDGTKQGPLPPARMDMFTIPIPEVVALLEENGVVIEVITRDHATGEGWRSYEYIAKRP